MSLFLHPAFDPDRFNPRTQTAWVAAHGVEGRPDASTEPLGIGPAERMWRYQRQPYSRILLEMHGDSETVWSLYLMEGASGGCVVIGNVDTEVATALTLPAWMRRYEAAVLWSLELEAPMLLQGLKGGWPHHAQLIFQRLPGDPEPHWLVAKVLDTVKWADLGANAGLKAVLQDQGLHIAFSGCYHLVREAARQRSEGALRGLARAGFFGAAKAVKIILDHEERWALNQIKGLIIDELGGGVTASVGSIPTSLEKPPLFRFLEEQQHRGGSS
jgi:hypothetical protein